MTTDLPDGPAGTAPPDPAAATQAPAAPAVGTGAASRRRRRVLLAAVAVVLLAVGAAALLRWSPWSALPEGAAFRVGDTVVTESQVQRRTDVLAALYGIQVPEDPERFDQFRRDTAKAMAISLVLDRAADAAGIDIADKSVSDALDRFLEQRYPGGGRAEYVQALAARGVGERDVLEEIRRQLEVRDLFDRATEDVTVSEEELRRLFEADPAQYAVPERRQLRHVVVADEATAQAVLRRLAAGEAFATVAAQVSLDGSTKDKGGDLGLLGRSELDPAFAEAAFAGAPGATFGPVQTSLGWHVGAVDQVVPGEPTTFEQVAAALREQQETERAVAAWRAHVVELVEAADVEYDPDHRPADPRPDLGVVPTQPVPTPSAAATR